MADRKVDNKQQAFLMRVALEEEKGLLAFLVRLFLSVLEFIYSILLKIHCFFSQRRRLPVPVISVGNITVGGTGKTPTVIWLARFLIKEGFNPAILTRGYGGSRQSEGIIFSNSGLPSLKPAETGDEPYLLARLLPQTLVAVGRERYRMGLKVRQTNSGIDLFILDDGFQHWPLERDLDILIIEASRPFSNGHLLPRGLLREPLSGIKRAGIILLTRTGKVTPEDLQNLNVELRRRNPAALIAPIEETYAYLEPLWGGERIAATGFLPGRKISAVTGIGNPRQFLASLETLGAEVGYFKNYPDHYQWLEEEVDNLLEVLKEWGFSELIVTAKDGVKLESFSENFRRKSFACYILTQEFSVADPAVTAKIKAIFPKER